MPFLGAHMPTAGGLHLAFSHIEAVHGEAMQLFTRNQRQWSAAPISDEEATAFAAAWATWPFPHVFSHASYLINLASPDDALWQRSINALAAELSRCARLGIAWTVLHPGAHVGSGTEAGIARVAAGLDAALKTADEESGGKTAKPGVLLENTAGQGTTLGADPEELAAILAASRFGADDARLAVCWDTCHGFAAGHDLRTSEAWAATSERIEAAFGLSRLRLVHLNDSMQGLGEHKDRHQHIGEGEIGRAGFAQILNDPRLTALPMCLETPKEKNLRQDRENLRVLRSLLSSGR
ncbi:endonuclease 4 [Desulfovibrio sp. X2]|uniref:deoxyribonuclease IV n=1 Tax=Desulfovibrio sp. X2 TaxID=941449 RepID=UPI0003587525|nr:deoxyribonuclease IV [Desulfovibrio sp. X2]EPR39994.1 endonuclease 4 [Desulfovibrio sp. X2]